MQGTDEGLGSGPEIGKDSTKVIESAACQRNSRNEGNLHVTCNPAVSLSVQRGLGTKGRALFRCVLHTVNPVQIEESRGC